MSQSVVIAALLTAFLMGDQITYNALLLVALGLGFAGASFAVALPQAGQWYPPKLQGVVLGIAGAGNIGVVIDFLGTKNKCCVPKFAIIRIRNKWMHI